MNIVRQTSTAILMFVTCVVICGAIYPAMVTLVAQQLFPAQANGSLIEQNGKKIGSELIGQHFTSAKYFWGRPSATKPFPYNAAASVGSNLAPANPVLIEQIKERADLLRNLDPNVQIPADMVTTSGSGLDPHISIRNAMMQVQRIAKARNMDERKIINLIKAKTEAKFLWIFGAERVNVLRLNLALDAMHIVMNNNE